jgi:glutathione S-transferase
MTTRSSKRQKPAPYELVYWGGIPGRGENVRMAFEATGTPFKDVCVEANNDQKAVLEQISTSNKGDDINPPPLAPPILRHGDMLISQTPNILLYLGTRLGLAPDADDDGYGYYHVNALTLTALDGLSNEAHDTHHPISSGSYYEDQQEESVKKAADYRDVRLPKFLEYFERVLSGPASGGEYLYGGRLTYADLVLYQCLNGVSYAFPKCIQKTKDSGKYSKVWALYDRVEGHEKIKAYLASERRQKYGMGIYRQYPELDG